MKIIYLSLVFFITLSTINLYADWFDDFEQAAKKGNDVAMYQLGNLYENGLGIENNNQLAFEWYKKAAEKGNKSAKKKIENWKTD